MKLPYSEDEYNFDDWPAEQILSLFRDDLLGYATYTHIGAATVPTIELYDTGTAVAWKFYDDGVERTVYVSHRTEYGSEMMPDDGNLWRTPHVTFESVCQLIKDIANEG